MAKVEWDGPVALPTPNEVALTLVPTPHLSAAAPCRTPDVEAHVTSSGSEASQPWLIIAVTNKGPRLFNRRISWHSRGLRATRPRFQERRLSRCKLRSQMAQTTSTRTRGLTN